MSANGPLATRQILIRRRGLRPTSSSTMSLKHLFREYLGEDDSLEGVELTTQQRPPVVAPVVVAQPAQETPAPVAAPRTAEVEVEPVKDRELGMVQPWFSKHLSASRRPALFLGSTRNRLGRFGPGLVHRVVVSSFFPFFFFFFFSFVFLFFFLPL